MELIYSGYVVVMMYIVIDFMLMNKWLIIYGKWGLFSVIKSVVLVI